MGAVADRPIVLRQLVALRREARMSQLELAGETGTGQSAISELETGTVLPNLATLLRLADYFGMTVVLTPKGGTDA